MPFVKALPQETTAIHVWSLKPEAYEAWPPLISACMRSDSELTNGEKELIGAYSSALRGCTHCYTAHYPIAIALGIDEALFNDVLQDPQSAPVDEKFRPILVYVHKFITDPNRLIQADADAVFAAGWSEKTLTDVVFICAAFGFMNSIMQGHGADETDLSGIGPIHTIIREKADYGHAKGSGRGNPEDIIAEVKERYGEEVAMKAFQRAKELGMTP